jgi:hypothetical protein
LRPRLEESPQPLGRIAKRIDGYVISKQSTRTRSETLEASGNPSKCTGVPQLKFSASELKENMTTSKAALRQWPAEMINEFQITDDFSGLARYLMHRLFP